MSDRLLKESDVLKIAFQLPLIVNSAFADAVKTLPSADRPQEWIPCSERLPSKSGEYLVTIIQNEESFQQGVTGIFIRSLAPANILYGERFGKQLTWRKELWEDVVAWMPLPKPWKEVNDECS